MTDSFNKIQMLLNESKIIDVTKVNSMHTKFCNILKYSNIYVLFIFCLVKKV